MDRIGLAKIMDATGISRTLLTMRRWFGTPWLPVLTYHQVLPATDGELPSAVDATTEQLDAQLALLSRQFRFVDTADVIAFFRGKPLPPNPVMVTFDDGYRECHSEVLPILQRHGAKATFFITSGPIESRRPFWWHQVALFVERSTRPVLELTYPFPIRFHRDGTNDADVNAGLAGIVKSYIGLDLERFLEHVSDVCGVTLTSAEERELADATLMTWEQVRELADAGMDVQSHTRTHRVLHTLLPSEIGEELALSRSDIEAVIERPVRALAYPVGYCLQHLGYVSDALREAGYALAFTNQTGVNHIGRPPGCYDIRRIAMSTRYDDRFFRAMMALPYLAPTRTRAASASPPFVPGASGVSGTRPRTAAAAATADAADARSSAS
jgi:peptidoglycan/xylan/chitin deacetylase (PgdA/CDA1 family)